MGGVEDEIEFEIEFDVGMERTEPYTSVLSRIHSYPRQSSFPVASRLFSQREAIALRAFSHFAS